MFQNAMRKKQSGEGGFTLIELLIVIVILGILAAVVVFAVGGIQDKGTTSACKAERKTIEVALEAYYAKHTAYPANYAAITSGNDKFLRDSPTNHTIDGSGNITGINGCP